MTVEASRVGQPAPRTMPGRGNWWIEPVLVVVGFTAFVIYSTWTVVNGAHYEVGPYLSPYYSPLFKFGFWPLSPAWLVAWVPSAFRATCYYYRKAYYRAFFWDPPACALREPALRRRYHGETRFPLVLNNLHRFFLYLVIPVLAVLWFDTGRAFYYHGGLYVGVGSVIMLVNVVLLTLYTFSCHALRHLVGGSVDCYSCAVGGNARHGLWGFVSRLNPLHGAWAWYSLVSVMVADAYIRLVANGVFGSGCFGTHTGC